MRLEGNDGKLSPTVQRGGERSDSRLCRRHESSDRGRPPDPPSSWLSWFIAIADLKLGALPNSQLQMQLSQLDK